MAMTTTMPPVPPGSPLPDPPPAPPSPDDPPHMPMVERVASIEDTLTQLMARHNAFVNTVVKELGLD